MVKKIFVIFIVVVGGVFIYGKFFFDVNDYRDNIASYLSGKTGYEVTYTGRINLEYEPSAKITVNEAATSVIRAFLLVKNFSALI